MDVAHCDVSQYQSIQGLVAYSIIERKLLNAEADNWDDEQGECVLSPVTSTSISTGILLLFNAASEPTTSASHVSRGSETSDIS
jgi:hypothetical protein